MKKLITLFLASFFISAISFGQTKEETIKWLKEKFEKCGYIYHGAASTYTDLKYDINECRIVVSSIKERNGTVSGTHTFEFPTTGVKIWGGADVTNEFHNTHPGVLGYNNDVVKIDLVITNSKETLKSSLRYSRETAFIGDGIKWGFYLENKEENIHQRIQKALDHLATFCPKTKETF